VLALSVKTGSLLLLCAALGGVAGDAGRGAIWPRGGVVQDTGRVRLRLAPAGNEARYRVTEQLAGVTLPNDAVGSTAAVSGGILLAGRGDFVADSSQITIDLASLETDRDRRDNYVRGRVLEVARYPTAVLMPRAVRGLAWPLPVSGEHTFQLVGDLTLHGVTKPTTWDVTATFARDRISGTARTHFKFADFDLTQPRVPVVLSVQDSIRLEYDFAFLR